MTTQIVHSPILGTDHGGSFVTPNTDYVIEGGQYPVPLDGSYAPISDFDDKYRGAVMFWKFDRAKGRIDPPSRSPWSCRPTCRTCPTRASW